MVSNAMPHNFLQQESPEKPTHESVQHKHQISSRKICLSGNSAGWNITEEVEMVGGCVCCFVYTSVTFFFLTSYFHTTSFIMLICEVERNASEVERSGTPAA